MSDNAIHIGGDFNASILPQVGSDHWPIMLQWTRLGSRCNIPFHFEAFWFSHPNFKDIVKDAWNSFIPPEGAKMFKFQQKLKHLKKALKSLNRTHFGNIFYHQKDLEQQMKILQ